MDKCTVCGRDVNGGFEVHSSDLPSGEFYISIDGTPDRDFNVCDLCNDTICYDCSIDKDSGYCNVCYSKVYGKRASENHEATS